MPAGSFHGATSVSGKWMELEEAFSQQGSWLDIGDLIIYIAFDSTRVFPVWLQVNNDRQFVMSSISSGSYFVTPPTTSCQNSTGALELK